jgi:hypothetical protein
VHLGSIDQLDHYLPPDAVRECKKDEIERLRTLRDELKSKPPDEVITELDALSKQIEDCERRLVRTAVRLEFDSKTNVRFWTHLDYLLFGIGSVLTLFGKLAKGASLAPPSTTLAGVEGWFCPGPARPRVGLVRALVRAFGGAELKLGETKCAKFLQCEGCALSVQKMQ